MASQTLLPQSVTLRVSMGREAGPGLESQVILWVTSPRRARNRDICGEENGPGASVRGRWRGRQQGLGVSQVSLSPGRKGELSGSWNTERGVCAHRTRLSCRAQGWGLLSPQFNCLCIPEKSTLPWGVSRYGGLPF